MTVREFKELLEKYPSDMPVMVSGYEDGWDDVKPGSVSKQTVVRRHSKESFQGRYEEPDLLTDSESANRSGKPFEALTVARESY